MCDASYLPCLLSIVLCPPALCVCPQLLSSVCYDFVWGLNQFCVLILLTLCLLHVYRVNTCAYCYFFTWCWVSFARCVSAHFVRDGYYLRSLWYDFQVWDVLLCVLTTMSLCLVYLTVGGYGFSCVTTPYSLGLALHFAMRMRWFRVWWLFFPWVWYPFYCVPPLFRG